MISFFITLLWGEKGVTFTGSGVECQGYGVTIGLGHVSEALALRKVLPDQAVGVFVGCAFPRVVRCSEVEAGACRGLDCLVAAELGAVVCRDRSDAPARLADQVIARLPGNRPRLSLLRYRLRRCFIRCLSKSYSVPPARLSAQM